jgi:hypothetical protein
MRLVSYSTEPGRRCGIQVGDTVYDASAIAQAAGLSLDYQSTDWSKTKKSSPVMLKDGDVVEVEIERIGRLANPVHDRNRVGLRRSDANQIREEGIK